MAGHVSFSIAAAARFGRGLGRAMAGAIIFAVPLFMTMEMWWLGLYMPEWKLMLLLIVFFPFLVVLSWHAGFERTFSWRDDVMDALVAYAVGFVASGALLWLMGLLGVHSSLREVVGKVGLQAIPGSMGALLAQAQLGEQQGDADEGSGFGRWGSEVFMMGAGALFLAFNLAPTQEMLLIAVRMGPLKAMALMLVSLVAMHAFVYGVAFRGGSHAGGNVPGWTLFLRFTLVGYAVALLLSAAMLWLFGRLEGLSVQTAVAVIAVLGFPAAIGAASARLIL